MPYIFSPADVNADSAGFADMKTLRASFEPMFVSVTKSKQLVDANGNVLGRVTWVKELRPKGFDVPMVQADPERPSVEDVLASIDDLERDAELDEARRDGVTDDDDADDAPAPVRFDVTPAEDIDAIVDWQMRGHEDDIITTTPAPGTMGTPPAPRAPRVARGPRQPRMSHKNCGHAITGQAGKEARAACRAAHRAAQAIAS